MMRVPGPSKRIARRALESAGAGGREPGKGMCGWMGEMCRRAGGRQRGDEVDCNQTAACDITCSINPLLPSASSATHAAPPRPAPPPTQSCSPCHPTCAGADQLAAVLLPACRHAKEGKVGIVRREVLAHQRDGHVAGSGLWGGSSTVPVGAAMRGSEKVAGQ